MKEKRFSRHSFRIASFIFLPLFILANAVLWTFYHLEVQSKKNILQIQASHTINLQRSQIAGDFSMIVADLLFFANYSQLFAMMDEPGINKQRLTDDLALFSRDNKIYDQVRIIDAHGKESIRINYVAGKAPLIVKEENLQDKKERYYFKDTFSLKKGEIFVSPLDLNVEQGKVEIPNKPMIRFGTPIFDKEGQKRGIIIFNYYAVNLIQDIYELAGASSYHCMMMNPDGYWLINKSCPKLEWGFMFEYGKDLSMKIQEPETWKKITAVDYGQFSSDKGLYTFTTIYPLRENWKSSTGAGRAFAPSLKTKKAKEYSWVLLLYLPKDLLNTGTAIIRTKYLLLNLTVFLLLAVIAFRFAWARIKEEQAVKELQQSRENLEIKVKERTEELVTANRTFQSLVESTVGHIGQNFFNNLVDKLGSMLGSECAILGQIIQPYFLKVLAMKLDGKIIENYSFKLPGSLFDMVVQKGFCHYPDQVRDLFPGDIELLKMKAVGYAGKLVVDGSGEAIGILCAISSERLELPPNSDSIMSILAARAAIEIERIEKEKESKQLALRLQQAQKMEAIGTLAGGIAHDFNNILSIIFGYTELAKKDAPPGLQYSQELDRVLQAGHRAKDLVQQILTFSRQAQVKKILIKPFPIIKEALRMLRSSIPTTIEIQENISNNCGSIIADPTQFYQIIMNLCTNAFHAMEVTGGVMTIGLNIADSVPLELGDGKVEAEKTFIELSCSDTGKGIEPDVIDKIFDPFFTTKEEGKGTGMGLAITYGIVKEYGGNITVESQPGKGTTFRIYLPQINKEPTPVPSGSVPVPRGNERILFLDDEEISANMAKDMLERLGYHVTIKKTSFDALETFRAQPDKFDLVITDQTMPGMTGIDIAEIILRIRPDTPIILCTGYSPFVNEEMAKAQGIKEFMLKPITEGAIAKLIRKALGENGTG